MGIPYKGIDEKIIYEVIGLAVLEKLRELNLIDETALRNYIIKNDYKKLRETYDASEAVSMLCDKYFLSDSALNSILFRKK